MAAAGPVPRRRGVCAELTILAQSRGAAIVVPLARSLYFALVPGRVRALFAFFLVAAATGLAAGPLLDVYPAAKDGIGLAGAIDDAISSVWLGVRSWSRSGRRSGSSTAWSRSPPGSRAGPRSVARF